MHLIQVNDCQFTSAKGGQSHWLFQSALPESQPDFLRNQFIKISSRIFVTEIMMVNRYKDLKLNFSFIKNISDNIGNTNNINSIRSHRSS